MSVPGFLTTKALGAFEAARAGLAVLLAGITAGTTVAVVADATAATVATGDDEAGTGGATATDEAVPSAPDASDAASNGPDACAATSVAGLDPDNILKAMPATASTTAAATHNIPLFLAGAEGGDEVGAEVGSGVTVAGAAAASASAFGSAVTCAEGTVANEGSGGVASAVVVAVLGSITVLSFACASVIGRRGTS